MMEPKPKAAPAPIVYAFIDAQNMHMATDKQGWQVSFVKFREYLSKKYSVTRAMMFFGYLPQFEDLYAKIRRAGFEVVFQDVLELEDGSVKGNVDVNLTIYACCEMYKYQKAILVTADGDFSPLVKLLKRQAKHPVVISPAPREQTSVLLRRAAGNQLMFIEGVRDKISR